jgi:Protein of unknown function with HXXEE motif
MPRWVAVHSSQLPVHPREAGICSGWLLLTLAAFAVTDLSARGQRQALGVSAVWIGVFGYAVAMLVNLLLPHIPATLVLGEYTPGVVTAVLIKLPIMSILLFQAVREQWVPGTQAMAYAVLVPLAIGRDSGPVGASLL